MRSEKGPRSGPPAAARPEPRAWPWGAPEPGVRALGREGEVLVAKVRIGMGAVALLTVLLAPPREPWIFAGGYAAMLLVGLLLLLLARREVPVPGLGLF